jgi:hypothetical protein
VSRPLTRTAALAVTTGALLAAVPALAQRAVEPPRGSVSDLTTQVVRTTQAYRATVERSLPLHQAAVESAAAALHERRVLHRAGVLPEEYVRQAEMALATAQRDLDEARSALDEADELLLQAEIRVRLERLAPLPRGGYEDVPAAFVRFNGTSPWRLKDLPRLEQEFAAAFQRSLPLSAVGQTRVHDRLGLDHRTAADVAVHPDSAEGAWLMKHLRQAGIPFIGVRATVPGSSTGAHIHIGSPSPRLLAR